MNSNLITRGLDNPALQEEFWDYDPSRGFVHGADYKGINPYKMDGLQGDFVRAGIACRLTHLQGGTASLQVVDSTQQYTLDVWQFVGQEVNLDIFSHPAALALFGSTANGPAQIAAIRAGLAADTSSTVAFADGTPSAPNSLAALRGTIVQRFYDLAFYGQDSFEVPTYVLRHTTNAPNRWQANIADFNINAIYQQASLLSEAGSASLWAFPLPARMAYKIAHLAIPATLANRQVGWLKKPSTETTAANNRIEITQDYIFGNISTDLYGPVV